MSKSSSVMTKRSFKTVKLHLNRFNEVAIPCHVDLLRKHKSNIVKFQEIGDWKKVYQEQINATRIVKQLNTLLQEVEALRLQVEESDLQKFDSYIAKSKQSGLDIINEYLALKIYLVKPSESNDHLAERNCYYGTETISHVQDENQILEDDIRNKEECLKAYNNLQIEVQELTDMCNSFSRFVQDQAEPVNDVENHVLVTEKNVKEGNQQLLKALKYSTAAFPVCGAVIGTAIGGPIGLFLGAKMGSLVAIGGMALGYTGGRLLKKTEDKKYQANVTEMNVIKSDTTKVKMSS